MRDMFRQMTPRRSERRRSRGVDSEKAKKSTCPIEVAALDLRVNENVFLSILWTWRERLCIVLIADYSTDISVVVKMENEREKESKKTKGPMKNEEASMRASNSVIYKQP